MIISCICDMRSALHHHHLPTRCTCIWHPTIPSPSTTYLGPAPVGLHPLLSVLACPGLFRSVLQNKEKKMSVISYSSMVSVSVGVQQATSQCGQEFYTSLGTGYSLCGGGGGATKWENRGSKSVCAPPPSRQGKTFCAPPLF